MKKRTLRELLGWLLWGIMLVYSFKISEPLDLLYVPFMWVLLLVLWYPEMLGKEVQE